MTRRMPSASILGLIGSRILFFFPPSNFPGRFTPMSSSNLPSSVVRFEGVFVRFSLAHHPRGKAKTTQLLAGSLRFWSHLFVRSFLPFVRSPTDGPFHGKGSSEQQRTRESSFLFRGKARVQGVLKSLVLDLTFSRMEKSLFPNTKFLTNFLLSEFEDQRKYIFVLIRVFLHFFLFYPYKIYTRLQFENY